MTQDYIVALLKMTSIGSLVFFFFIAGSAKARKSRYHSFIWLFFGLSLMFTMMFTNAVTVQNPRVLAFLFPELISFSLFLGPAFFFMITNTRPKSRAHTFYHLAWGATFLSGGIYQGIIYDFTTNDFDELWNSGKPLLQINYPSFTKKPLHILIAPFHFASYLFKTRKKNIPSYALGFGLCLLAQLILLNFVFSGYWSGTSFSIVLLLCNAGILAFGLQYVLEYPLSKYEKNAFANGEVPEDYDKIHSYIYGVDSSFNKHITTSGVSLMDLAENSGISLDSWSLYLLHEHIDFIHFKKKYRVALAKELITSGYLEQHTVEALTKKIGYQSRTSFYNAFKELSGQSLKDFKDSL